MVTDIFIKVWKPDYPFLEYALRSIEKFCSGFRNVIIVAPTRDCPSTKHLGRIHVLVDDPRGYLHQQLVKLRADEFTDADCIVFHDADCVFTQLVTPAAFMQDGKAVIEFRPWALSREDERQAWIPVVEKWLKQPVENNFMCRHPFFYPRWVFQAAREFCLNAHGVELSEYVYRDYSPTNMLTFSEFNCMNAFLYAHHRDKFTWRDLSRESTPTVIHQEWSRGGLTPEVRARMEEILAR
jgi:hypothetical protein